MSQKRKLHELKGTILFSWPGKSKSKIYKNQPFYVLEVELENLFSEPKKTQIYVFFNLVSEEVWKELEAEKYKGEKYLFFCEKRVRGWRLKELKEL